MSNNTAVAERIYEAPLMLPEERQAKAALFGALAGHFRNAGSAGGAAADDGKAAGKPAAKSRGKVETGGEGDVDEDAAANEQVVEADQRDQRYDQGQHLRPRLAEPKRAQPPSSNQEDDHQDDD